MGTVRRGWPHGLRKTIGNVNKLPPMDSEQNLCWTPAWVMPVLAGAVAAGGWREGNRLRH
jgi:hypothetical protein